jgi:hypothetical protein
MIDASIANTKPWMKKTIQGIKKVLLDTVIG